MSARIASVITLRGLARFFSCRLRSRIRSAIFGGSTGESPRLTPDVRVPDVADRATI
ncbi:TPA: hypothetical protein N8422_001716 [Escherichia coli]|nr:hypothetical protein [Escherichia coli]